MGECSLEELMRHLIMFIINFQVIGQAEMLVRYAGVNPKDIKGMRAPFLAVGGDTMFRMLNRSDWNRFEPVLVSRKLLSTRGIHLESMSKTNVSTLNGCCKSSD